MLNQFNVVAGTRETMIPDIQGSIIGMLDSAGTLSKTGYQPYGENPILTAGTFQYTARRFDPETAGSTSQPSGLYYDRARTYSPTWGRFLQPDPIGYASAANLYAYVNNDPLNRTDPFGEQAVPGFLIGGISGGAAGYIAGGPRGLIIGGIVGAGVGIVAAPLSGTAATAVLTATGSTAAAVMTGTGAFVVFNAAAGALATAGTNIAENQPLTNNLEKGAIIGGLVPLASGEAYLIGPGAAVVTVPQLAAPTLAVQSGIFGVIGALATSPHPGK